MSMTLSRRTAIAAGAFAGMAILAVLRLVAARAAFERQITDEINELFAARAPSPPAVPSDAALTALPEPVQRWLRWSGAAGQGQPSTVRLKYGGEFRLGEGKGWTPYQSETYYTTAPPALLWHVNLRMFPLVSVIGRDRYVRGEGSMRMKLLGLIPVVDKRGGGLTQGDLLRYLGEIVWFPLGALSPHITWHEVDAYAARATMAFAGVSGSLTFFFDDEGRPTREEAADRYNDAKDRPEPWSVPITAWGEFHGVRMPVVGEAVWNYATSDYSYIRWRVTDVEYNQPVVYGYPKQQR